MGSGCTIGLNTEGRFSRFAFIEIALLLIVLAVRLYESPASVRAQSEGFYIEPGFTIIRSRDGLTRVKGKVSKPIFLVTFDFSAMRRQR